MLAGFKARNHPQQTKRGRGTAVADDRRTPREWWEKWDREFGPFTLDVAASAENALCAVYFNIEDDGLLELWSGRVWCNPPFSEMPAWIEKAWEQSVRCDVIAMLVPANRTEQRWWQESIEPYRGSHQLLVRFLPGRLRFGLPITDPRGDRPPFGCALLVWRR